MNNDLGLYKNRQDPPAESDCPLGQLSGCLFTLHYVGMLTWPISASSKSGEKTVYKIFSRGGGCPLTAMTWVQIPAGAFLSFRRLAVFARELE